MTPKLKLTIDHVSSPLRTAFAISRGAKTSAETVRVTLESNGIRARGECVPYTRYDETIESVVDQIETARRDIERKISLEELQLALPAGAARCAVDCALWDFEAKSTGTPVWSLAGLPEPRRLETAETVSLASPAEMAENAKKVSGRILKLKLGSEDDLARVTAVHDVRPDARLILDANEGMDPSTFPEIAANFVGKGVALIEQPYRAGEDSALTKYASPIAVCADESAHTSDDIEALVKLYDVVNIKLDKAGGLTEALKMAQAAKTAGMGVMVGCMVASSLSMAPATLLGHLADVVDLDGPLWLANDIENGLTYHGGFIEPPSRQLWG